MTSLVWRVLYPLGKTKSVLCISLAWVLIASVFYLRNSNQGVQIKGLNGMVANLGVKDSKANRDNSLNWIDFSKVTSGTVGRVKQVKNCVIPQLLDNDPVMMRFFKKLAPPQCTDEEWLYVDNGTVRFSKSALEKHKNVTCDYYPLLRDGDFAIKYGNPVKNIRDGFKMTSDFFKGVCLSMTKNETNLSIYSGIHYSDDRTKRSDNADPLTLGFQGMSIAILGFDSMSRMSWHRRLKETRSYFKDTLKAIELESHNIVGDGTTAVMFPMLTGKFEWELPECR